MIFLNYHLVTLVDVESCVSQTLSYPTPIVCPPMSSDNQGSTVYVLSSDF